MFNPTRENLLRLNSLRRPAEEIEVTLRTASDNTYHCNSRTAIPCIQAGFMVVTPVVASSLVCSSSILPTFVGSCLAGAWLGDNCGHFVFEAIRYIANNLPEENLCAAELTVTTSPTTEPLNPTQAFQDRFTFDFFPRPVSYDNENESNNELTPAEIPAVILPV